MNKKEWIKKYLKNPSIYKEYLLLMRKLSKKNKMNLRSYERKLFEDR